MGSDAVLAAVMDDDWPVGVGAQTAAGLGAAVSACTTHWPTKRASSSIGHLDAPAAVEVAEVGDGADDADGEQVRVGVLGDVGRPPAPPSPPCRVGT